MALPTIARTYNITANWQSKDSKGNSDGSGSDTGTVVINANGTVASCSVGVFIRCIGGFAYHRNEDGVTFSISASGGSKSGELSGSVNRNYDLSGSLSGDDIKDNSTLTGTLTGRRQ